MNAEGERVELEDEVLPPGEDVSDGLAMESVDAYAAVALYREDPPADKGPELFRSEMNRRPFHKQRACISRTLGDVASRS